MNVAGFRTERIALRTIETVSEVPASPHIDGTVRVAFKGHDHHSRGTRDLARFQIKIGIFLLCTDTEAVRGLFKPGLPASRPADSNIVGGIAGNNPVIRSGMVTGMSFK